MGTYLLFGLLMALGFAVLVAVRIAVDDISGLELALSVAVFFAMIALWPLFYLTGIAFSVRSILTAKKAV
ncbi:hypothetical protein [Nocardia brasiliensis]|uniref:hypothetical protein n=1 Tax=Nocardia brasiliensis TaxID=37326 RepID=UPI002457C12F|nr:hypothetical protein [Nocardia brasiliensis]